MSNVTVNGSSATTRKARGLTLDSLKPGESFTFKNSSSPSVYLKITDERSERQNYDSILDDYLVKDNAYVSVATGQLYVANPNSRVTRVKAEMFT